MIFFICMGFVVLCFVSRKVLSNEIKFSWQRGFFGADEEKGD